MSTPLQSEQDYGDLLCCSVHPLSLPPLHPLPPLENPTSYTHPSFPSNLARQKTMPIGQVKARIGHRNSTPRSNGTSISDPERSRSSSQRMRKSSSAPDLFTPSDKTSSDSNSTSNLRRKSTAVKRAFDNVIQRLNGRIGR